MEKVIVTDYRKTFNLMWEVAEKQMGLTGFRYEFFPEEGREYNVIDRIKHPKAGKPCYLTQDVYTTNDILAIEDDEGHLYLIDEAGTKAI